MLITTNRLTLVATGGAIPGCENAVVRGDGSETLSSQAPEFFSNADF
jgi:hypothetical protein